MGAVSYVVDTYGVGCDGMVFSKDCDGGRGMWEYSDVDIVKVGEYGDVDIYVVHVGI